MRKDTEKPSYYVRLATVIVDKRKLIFFLYACALLFCLFNAGCIICLFTFFVAVVRRESFRPQFVEMLSISFGVAAVSFFIGWAAKTWMGIDM